MYRCHSQQYEHFDSSTSDTYMTFQVRLRSQLVMQNSHACMVRCACGQFDLRAWAEGLRLVRWVTLVTSDSGAAALMRLVFRTIVDAEKCCIWKHDSVDPQGYKDTEFVVHGTMMKLLDTCDIIGGNFVTNIETGCCQIWQKKLMHHPWMMDGLTMALLAHGFGVVSVASRTPQ